MDMESRMAKLEQQVEDLTKKINELSEIILNATP